MGIIKYDCINTAIQNYIFIFPVRWDKGMNFSHIIATSTASTKQKPLGKILKGWKVMDVGVSHNM